MLIVEYDIETRPAMNPVEVYIDNQPESHRALWLHLRWFILSRYDDVKEGIKYRIPFFMLKGKNWIYLNPREGGIDVSFLNGTRMIDVQSHLRIDGRKNVGSYFVPSLEELNQNELEFLIDHSMHEHLGRF
ncbi:MAG: DUF1801 domain-containing protein [Flavobacteriia bacterium]|nr:DUF1801 domain-containing protein [Flavobacteriia bacterium]